MTLLANIAEERLGAVAIARIEGEIDASNVAWVGGRLHGLVSNQLETLIVDLSQTTYLDSAGIALLFRLAGELREHQQELRLVVHDGSSIARMVTLTGLRASVPTHAALDDALDG
jgi:anti-anti-sigma factor